MKSTITWDNREQALVATRMISFLSGQANPTPNDWEQAYRKAQISLPLNRRKAQGWRNEFTDVRDEVEIALEKLGASVLEKPVDRPSAPPSPEPVAPSKPPVASPAPPSSERGFHGEDAELMYQLIEADLHAMEGRIVDKVFDRLRPFLELIGEKMEGRSGKEFGKLLGKHATRVCIYNIEGKMSVHYREKLQHLPITVEFITCDQPKVVPKAGQYDLIIYTQEGNHGAWEGLKTSYTKGENLFFCKGGVVRVVERVTKWLTEHGIGV